MKGRNYTGKMRGVTNYRKGNIDKEVQTKSTQAGIQTPIFKIQIILLAFSNNRISRG